MDKVLSGADINELRQDPLPSLITLTLRQSG